MSESVQVLNYTAHAIDEFEALIPHIRADVPGILDAHRKIVKYLRNSVKFLLPNCADLIDLGELRQAHVDMARLPFDVVALEAPWILPADAGGDPDALRFPKRIALCATMHKDVALAFPDTAQFLDEPGGGVIVIPIYWLESERSWKLPMGGVFVPHDNSVQDYVPGEVNTPTRMVNQPLIDAGLAPKKLRQFRVSPWVLLPEMFDAAVAKHGPAEVAASIIMTARDEVGMLLQTGCVLNCSNVRMPEISAVASLNKKRIAKGKEPFFSYRVLQVDDPRGAGAGAGGQHASPRAHLRRGHIRRLADRTVWVRAALVNTGVAAGAVDKAYAVRPKDARG
ncbi:hypothetical protein [Burkholderia cenocepacia]|uniref:hypothetical protein n=1 Tax=Burkholderia cenocepacia TaxID=95486 RepID=UPI002ABDC970|nr:hypothetical protein [Burkholderia cenocepacia]